MNNRKTLAIIMVISLILVSYRSFAQTAEELLPKAIQLEEVKGELEKAIEVYQTIVTSFPENKAIAAKAQFHIGLCYEKLGLKEAQKAYRAVVNNYPDQQSEVTLAKERLSALSETARMAAAVKTKDLTITKIYAGNTFSASISPDGNQLALIRPELSSRDIWIRDIATDKEIRLTNFINSTANVVWSPDNHWIAFADRDRDIKVVPTDGGPIQTLFTLEMNSSETTGITPSGWTSDSRKVIFHVPSKGLFAIPASGGVSEPVYTFESPDEAKKYEEMSLSPDGRCIAYSAAQNGNTDIFVMPFATQVPIRITLNPAADRKPRWSLDGNWLLFTSYGTENPQIWAIKISPNGEPEGSPVQISKDSHVLGGDWTGDASIGFSAAYRTEHIFTSNIDGTGETQITQFASFNGTPQWSPNGNRIAFCSDFRKPLNKFQLWTVSAGGGTPRLVSDKEVGIFLWSLDGEKLFFKAGAGSDRSTYMEVPAKGGEPKKIIPLPNNGDDPSRSPDGRSLAYTFTIKPAQFTTTDEYLKERLSGIGITPVGGGEPHILIPADKKGIWYSDCRLDPEGKRIAYIMFDYAQYGKEGMYTIWTMEVNGGTPRQIAQGGEYSLCWSPDAKWIVFEKRIKDMDFELYKVPANGGEPVKMNIKGRSPEFSPDGKKIAYSRRVESGYEYWLVVDFLPLGKLAQNQEEPTKSEGITINQVWTGIKADNTGSISSDGKYLSYVDWETGNLAIRDLTNGTSQSLTKDGTYEGIDQFAYSSVISPDFKQIAYAWLYNSTYELRLLNIDNPVPKTLYHNANESVFPSFWLPDGKKLIAKRYLSNSGKTKTQIISIDISDGSVNVLKTIDSDYQLRLSPSSDNKYIAYEYPTDLKSNNYDIHLLSINSNYETVLTNHPASDRLLGWMPNNNKVLFISNRSDSWDLWSVQIENGKLLGLPVRILPEIGKISPLGFTKDGSLYYSIFSRRFTGLITSFNLETGIAGQVESKKSMPGSVKFVEWSPDGESVAYGKEEKRLDDYFCKLCVQDLTTGTERCFDENFRLYNNSIRWNSDNQTILAVGYDETKRGQNNYFGGIYTFDTKTGQMNEILLLKGFENEYYPLYVAVAEWSADGKSIFYLSYSTDGDKTGNQITKYVLKTGEEKIIYKGKNLKRILRLSPTSDNLLFAYVNPENKEVHICTIPAEGGEVLEICTSQETERLSTAAWSPDGKSIFFAETPTLDYSKLWRVYSVGGKPQYVCQLPHLDVCLSIHPSGQKVALTYGEQTTEIRKIENLEQGLNNIYSQNE